MFPNMDRLCFQFCLSAHSLCKPIFGRYRAFFFMVILMKPSILLIFWGAPPLRSHHHLRSSLIIITELHSENSENREFQKASKISGCAPIQKCKTVRSRGQKKCISFASECNPNERNKFHPTHPHPFLVNGSGSIIMCSLSVGRMEIQSTDRLTDRCPPFARA